MKKILIATVVCACIAGPTFADMKVALTDGVGPFPGGAFNATVVGSEAIGENAVGATFETFCVETNEYIAMGSTYNATVDLVAIAGGETGTPVKPDPLDARTAYLYNQWLDGGITHTSANAGDLQNAIWAIEGETFTASAAVTGLINAAQGAISSGAWSGIHRIRVMNLTDIDTGALKQSMLVRVPVPAGVLLGFLGLAVAGLKLRRVV